MVETWLPTIRMMSPMATLRQVTAPVLMMLPSAAWHLPMLATIPGIVLILQALLANLAFKILVDSKIESKENSFARNSQNLLPSRV